MRVLEHDVTAVTPIDRVSFRFYAQLNDFLPAERRGRPFTRSLSRCSVKDAIESLGVPHTEVDLILVNGTAVDFGRLLRDKDAVSVYPPFRSLDLSGTTRAGAAPPEPIRFVADRHLRKLASFLRLAGFDTLLMDEDGLLAETAARESRVALTRDLGLLKRKIVRHGYFVRQTDPEAQFAEVLERFDLADRTRPFTRCLCCNVPVTSIAKDELQARVPVESRACFDDFHECRACGRVYWRGSHYDDLRLVLDRALHRATTRG